MPNSKAEQRRIVLARDIIRKVRPRGRVIDAVRDLVAIGVDLKSFGYEFISNYVAQSLNITPADAVAVRGLRGGRAKDNGLRKRNTEQEAACRSAEVAWCEVKRGAGVPSDPKRSHPDTVTP